MRQSARTQDGLNRLLSRPRLARALPSAARRQFRLGVTSSDQPKRRKRAIQTATRCPMMSVICARYGQFVCVVGEAPRHEQAASIPHFTTRLSSLGRVAESAYAAGLNPVILSVRV